MSDNHDEELPELPPIPAEFAGAVASATAALASIPDAEWRDRATAALSYLFAKPQPPQPTTFEIIERYMPMYMQILAMLLPRAFSSPTAPPPGQVVQRPFPMPADLAGLVAKVATALADLPADAREALYARLTTEEKALLDSLLHSVQH
jgi:hypothetical protein